MKYLIILCICFHGYCCCAQGNLMITPKRLVFEGQRKTQDVNLANTGTEKATYVISFQEIRMTEDGQFQQITAPDSGQLFASPYLRVFPRSVTLEANETQTIKLQFNRRPDMAAGEYRSHLYLRAIPKSDAAGEEQGKKDSGLSVKITPVFGFTIPVIVEVGNPTAAARLKNLQVTWKNNLPCLQATIERTGNKSVYANIRVQYTSANGKSSEVALIKGLAVYYPTAQRQFLLSLKDGVDYHTGKLKISYEEDSSKPNLLAEAEVQLN